MFTQIRFSILKFGIIGLVGLLFFSAPACSSTDKIDKRNGGGQSEYISGHSSIDNVSRDIDLTTHLKRISGVRVSGDGANATVTIRDAGVSTFSSSTTPLFVVDGHTMNTSYSNIYYMVNSYEIKSIEVLKGADAAMYGVRGGNGVIVITSKR